MKTLSGSSVQSDANCDILMGLFTVSQSRAKHSGITQDYFFSNYSNIGFCTLFLCVESSLRHPAASQRLLPQLQTVAQEITPNPDTFLAGPYRAKNPCHVSLCKNQPDADKNPTQKKHNPSRCDRETVTL